MNELSRLYDRMERAWRETTRAELAGDIPAAERAYARYDAAQASYHRYRAGWRESNNGVKRQRARNR